MSMHFSFNDGRAPSGQNPADRPGDERPFRILVIGDFSGRQSRDIREPLAGRKPIKVDLDALDDLPARLETRVRLPEQGGVEFEIRTIDDLHPDAIYDNGAVFAALRDLRKRARDPGAFRKVAEEVRAWAGDAARPASQIETKPSAVATPES